MRKLMLYIFDSSRAPIKYDKTHLQIFRKCNLLLINIKNIISGNQVLLYPFVYNSDFEYFEIGVSKLFIVSLTHH